MRDKAIMHQQRRLKQATQFSHKDSADLLPLDGLKRMGTSKDLVSGSFVDPYNGCDSYEFTYVNTAREYVKGFMHAALHIYANQ